MRYKNVCKIILLSLILLSVFLFPFSVALSADEMEHYYEELAEIVDEDLELYNNGEISNVGFDGFIHRCIQEINEAK